MLYTTSEYASAAELYTEVLRLSRHLGGRLGQARVLRRLGAVRWRTGDYERADSGRALRDLEQALAGYRETGDRSGYAEALNEFETLHRARGDAIRATESHRQALSVARDITSPHDEACILARCALDAGDISDAVAGLRRARKIFEQSGAAGGAELEAQLAALLPAKHSPR